MIIDITRGHVVFEFAGKRLTIQGEAYLPGHGSPDFVIYRNSIRRWDPPDHEHLIDTETREDILQALAREMRDSGMKVEIE
jgi:hypothetical protein